MILSKNGFILIAEQKDALGYEGDMTPNELPPNVQMLDCSSLVFSHSGYFHQNAVYEWIKKRITGEIVGPAMNQDMVLLADGNVVVTRRRTKELINSFVESSVPNTVQV